MPVRTRNWFARQAGLPSAVFRLLAGGYTVTRAADELALSVKTISTYRARLLRKLNLRTTADLVRYAVDHGI